MTREEFCSRLGIRSATLQLWTSKGWLLLDDTGSSSASLSEIDLARGQLIRHLGDEFGVNAEGIGIILDLLDQVHGLRSVLREVLQSSADRAER